MNWQKPQKTKKNQKSDFEKFENDELFSDLMRRIGKEILTEDDFSYIVNYEEYTERVKRYDRGIFKEGEKIGMEKGIHETVKNGILAGLSNEVIKLMTKLTDEQIDSIREELKKKGS